MNLRTLTLIHAGTTLRLSGTPQPLTCPIRTGGVCLYQVKLLMWHVLSMRATLSFLLCWHRDVGVGLELSKIERYVGMSTKTHLLPSAPHFFAYASFFICESLSAAFWLLGHHLRQSQDLLPSGEEGPLTILIDLLSHPSPTERRDPISVTLSDAIDVSKSVH
ncbi:hypothetical protein B0F90DRAFT_41710 [Multifurca ochricompacta]|uniref:Uncharacterized protein n=1 Tax=Multifurca ochricompacta TaxID=376703 RepID=A0AAD4MC60_9AGAM|nr:hypothetical protein B0F90DRAFT_41710 [Multifurca ochricompacta]